MNNPTPASRAAAEKALRDFLNALPEGHWPHKIVRFDSGQFLLFWRGEVTENTKWMDLCVEITPRIEWIDAHGKRRSFKGTGTIPPPLLERIREFSTAKGDAKEGREER